MAPATLAMTNRRRTRIYRRSSSRWLRRRSDRRRVRARPSLGAAAVVAVPAPGGDRRSDEPDRDRHRRDRHAVREPAVHGGGRRRRGPARRWASATGHQPRLAGAGVAGCRSVRLRPRGDDATTMSARRRRCSAPRSPARGSFVRTRAAVPAPRCSPIQPQSPGLAREDLVGLRHPRVCAAGSASKG